MGSSESILPKSLRLSCSPMLPKRMSAMKLEKRYTETTKYLTYDGNFFLRANRSEQTPRTTRLCHDDSINKPRARHMSEQVRISLSRARLQNKRLWRYDSI